MASDSRAVSCAFGITAPCKKIYTILVGKRKKPHVIGFAGQATSAMMFLEWFKSRDEALRTRILTHCGGDRSFHALIWDGKKLFDADEMCVVEEVDGDYYAIGSGACHAITAMDCGKGAVDAVRMAMKRDMNTGGRVVAVRI
jgi:ATP-dependent protease HslVU (ClpYQ) peptidase subunit